MNSGKSPFFVLLVLIALLASCTDQTTSTLLPTRTLAPLANPTITSQVLPTLANKDAGPVVVQILGCHTSMDVIRGLGEVTNAYVSLKNVGSVDLSSVCVTLNASDEGKPHPDKTRCFLQLPVGFQVVEKLTVDTKFRSTTSLEAVVTSRGQPAGRTTTVCREMDKELLDKIQEWLGKVRQ